MRIPILFVRLLSCLCLFLVLFPQLNCSAQAADSVDAAGKGTGERIVSTLLAPTLLIGAGVATMDDRGWYSSQDAYECIQRNYPGFHTEIDDYLVFIPAATVYGLNLAGVKGKHGFLDRSLVYLFSFSLAAATTGIIKGSTDILRPDGSDFRSFPSNHTTIAFVSATFLHEEFRDRSPWYGIAGYSIATASGVLRLMNNRHWMSDVLVGAGVGILATKAIYMLYPIVKGSFENNRGSNSSNHLSMAPYISRDHYGIFLQYQIH